MENSLELRVSSLEKDMENKPMHRGSVTKTRILSILYDAGYTELKSHYGVYHRVKHDSIEYVGFDFKNEDKMYHMKVNDINEGEEFLESIKGFNYVDENSSSNNGFYFVVSTITGAAIGGLFSILTHTVLNPSIPLLIGVAAGSSFYFSFLKEPQSSETKLLEEDLNKYKEIAFGFDALKSAIEEY